MSIKSTIEQTATALANPIIKDFLEQHPDQLHTFTFLPMNTVLAATALANPVIKEFLEQQPDQLRTILGGQGWIERAATALANPIIKDFLEQHPNKLHTMIHDQEWFERATTAFANPLMKDDLRTYPYLLNRYLTMPDYEFNALMQEYTQEESTIKEVFKEKRKGSLLGKNLPRHVGDLIIEHLGLEEIRSLAAVNRAGRSGFAAADQLALELGSSLNWGLTRRTADDMVIESVTDEVIDRSIALALPKNVLAEFALQEGAIHIREHLSKHGEKRVGSLTDQLHKALRERKHSLTALTEDQGAQFKEKLVTQLKGVFRETHNPKEPGKISAHSLNEGQVQKLVNDALTPDQQRVVAPSAKSAISR